MKKWGWAIAAIVVIVIVYEANRKIGLFLAGLAVLGMIASYYKKGVK